MVSVRPLIEELFFLTEDTDRFPVPFPRFFMLDRRSPASGRKNSRRSSASSPGSSSHPIFSQLIPAQSSRNSPNRPLPLVGNPYRHGKKRNNQILVGEIRGVEGSVAFSAMQTGHPVMSTFHASSVEKLIQRLCGDPINIPKTYVDNLNLIILTSAVKRPDGQTVRRMTSCNELVGYNAETGGFTFVQMFSWDPATDTFVWTGKGSSYLLENKIATMLGIPENRKTEIYLEVERRAKILERLHKAGYAKFWDLFHMITKIKKQGLLTIGS